MMYRTSRTGHPDPASFYASMIFCCASFRHQGQNNLILPPHRISAGIRTNEILVLMAFPRLSLVNLASVFPGIFYLYHMLSRMHPDHKAPYLEYSNVKTAFGRYEEKDMLQQEWRQYRLLYILSTTAVYQSQALNCYGVCSGDMKGYFPTHGMSGQMIVWIFHLRYQPMDKMRALSIPVYSDTLSNDFIVLVQFQIGSRLFIPSNKYTSRRHFP